MATSPLLQSVGQVSVTVTDVERAVGFYRDVLGLEHIGTFGRLALVGCGGTRLILSIPEGNAPSGTSVIYFSVENIDQAYDALNHRGVSFEGAPHRIHKHPDGSEEWMAFFRDPDRNLLGLMAVVKP